MNTSRSFQVQIQAATLPLSRGGSRGGWGDHPPKTYESMFIHHNFCNSENNIRDISPFCRPLFCDSNAVKYISSLLQ